MIYLNVNLISNYKQLQEKFRFIENLQMLIIHNTADPKHVDLIKIVVPRFSPFLRLFGRFAFLVI